MPKKSRQEKMMAAMRNAQKMQSPPTPTHTSSVEQPRATITPQIAQTTRYFISDMRKSILLIAGIITLELFFYFASMSTSLRSVFKI